MSKKDQKKEIITLDEKVVYDIVEFDGKDGCRVCDLFGKNCHKILDDKKRPSCVLPKNIIFKAQKYYPYGTKIVKQEKEERIVV